MIKEISFYDFDGTLIDSPLPEEGKEIWKEKTGEEYPHKGWWGRKESLDTKIFNIKPKDSVYKKYLKDKNDSDCVTVLLTNRLLKLKDYVLNILNENNIEFDEYSFKKGKEEKTDRILSFLKKYPNVKIINLYDDRDKEISLFKKFREEYGDKYIINIFNVKDNNILKEYYINRIERIIIEEVNNYLE